MPRKRLAFMSAIAAAASALLLSGFASAATQAPAAGRPAAAKTMTAPGTPAAKTPAKGGRVHVFDYTDNDGVGSTVILTGAIGDLGEAVSVNANGTINPEHNSELNLALNQGSFRIRIAGLDKKLVSALSHVHLNTSTCSLHVTATGAAPIVAGSGTGSYRGISGNFNLTVTVDEISSKVNCSVSGAFEAEAIVITGSGIVSFR
jgi:hypothetical protein